ncbi:D-malate degradation protein R [Ruegeria denitrificans]|uniref:D-malate degradation protein R n=1 Tax=Ruegeria denitrificans TaxID=1715692 RepID=A0A0P1IPN2_9RHOB|nr:LysR family transcriptional regulator [Ruegeria denitrificans]CUK17103.1 D-malate degradation protein R [Ruegeria denitrificans]
MDHNKDLFDGMVLFCTVVEQEGMSAAAKLLGHTPSHVSKEIARLEERLGTRLLNRTTRRISLTESGRIYYENARRIVDDTRAVQDRLHSVGDRPFGELRMSVPVVFAHGWLNDWLPEFLQRYPEVDLNIDVSERRADMIGEGIDLLVRIGDLSPSDLIVREIFCTQGFTVASPAYLKRKGTPCHPNDLKDHELIDFSFHGVTQNWTYPGPDGDVISVPIAPRVRCNDAHTEKVLALAGCGITRLPELSCKAELDSGALVAVLPDFRAPSIGVSVIYASRNNLPAKARAMIDFLVEKSG